MVFATKDARQRRLRVAMVGGGRGAFIGAVHRMAMRLDDTAELVAGALSQDAENARLSGEELGLPADRIYDDYRTMAEREAEREDGAEAVVIVTPNNFHAPVAKAFLAAGIDVICDKPLTTSLAEAVDLVAAAKRADRCFFVTHNHTAYAMLRQARAMVRGGELGAIRLVHATYMQDWLAERAEEKGLKQAEWRTDPARSGRSAALADIGVHAETLATFVTGLAVEAVAADLATLVEGRQLDDNAHVMVRYRGGPRGLIVASQMAPGHLNDLTLRVYGERGGLEWSGLDPEVLRHTPLGEPSRLLVRGGPGTLAPAARLSRMPARHPEGFIEGFGNLYRDAATLIRCRRDGVSPPDDVAGLVPTVEDGARGIAFIDAAVDSSEADGRWTRVEDVAAG